MRSAHCPDQPHHRPPTKAKHRPLTCTRAPAEAKNKRKIPSSCTRLGPSRSNQAVLQCTSETSGRLPDPSTPSRYLNYKGVSFPANKKKYYLHPFRPYPQTCRFSSLFFLPTKYSCRNCSASVEQTPAYSIQTHHLHWQLLKCPSLFNLHQFAPTKRSCNPISAHICRGHHRLKTSCPG